jgi:hypothetical protein
MRMIREMLALRRPCLLWILLGSLTLSACSESREVLPGASEVLGEPLAVEETPFLTLGGAGGDPDEEFFRVTRPFLLPNGHVVVPLAGYGEIRVFSPVGELVSTHGRPGEGPGEFRDLGFAWARGDTIEVFDWRLSRITRFGPDGSTETVALGDAGYRISSAVPGPLLDGWALVGITDSGYGRRDELAVSRFARDGNFIGIIAREKGMFRYLAGGMAGPTPLSPFPWVVIGGDLLYLGQSLDPVIRILGGTGEVLGEIQWEPKPVSPRDALREVVDLAVMGAPVDQGPMIRKRMAEALLPDRVPSFSNLLVDDQGYLWVRTYEVRRDAAGLPRSARRVAKAGGEWWIFTSKGERIGSIDLPHGLELHQITADAVVGVRRDENDLEYVQVHQLFRR